MNAKRNTEHLDIELVKGGEETRTEETDERLSLLKMSF